MNAEIICVGTELLLGHVLNTNAAFISKEFSSAGINTYFQTTVGDNPRRLAESIVLGISRSDVIIITGGLGPTIDDITLQAMSDALHKRLVFRKEILEKIKRYFKRSKIGKAPPEIKQQAMLPEGARYFDNKFGTAPGVILEQSGKIIIALPGPPRELEPMITNQVVPFLIKINKEDSEVIKTKTLCITGMVELLINNKIKDLLRLSGRTTVGIYVKHGTVEIKITAKAGSEKAADKEISAVEKTVRKRLGKIVFGENDDTLEGAVGKILYRKGMTLATAESCTGGLLADRITNVSGCSKYFKMGVIAYRNEVKKQLLGVDPELIEKYGAVSKETAIAMASGIKKLAGTDIGVGITGIAGPTGGTEKKPVGLVHISVIIKNKTYHIEKDYYGNRKENKWLSTCAALNILWKELNK